MIAEAGAHDHERLAGVLPRRLPERGHAVGDGLDAGDRGAAGGEGVQHARRAPAPVEEPVAVDRRRATLPSTSCADDRAGRRRRTAHSAEPEQHDHVDDEEVGGDGEDLARTPSRRGGCRTAMSAMKNERDRHRVAALRPSKAETSAAVPADDRHRDGEDVVGEQRRRRRPAPARCRSCRG